MRQRTLIADDEHDFDDAAEPAWHERTGVMVGAGLGVILALILLVFAVMRTAEQAKDSGSVPMPSMSSAPSSTTPTTLRPYTSSNGPLPPMPSTRDVVPTVEPPPSPTDSGDPGPADAPATTPWERYPTSSSAPPADAT